MKDEASYLLLFIFKKSDKVGRGCLATEIIASSKESLPGQSVEEQRSKLKYSPRNKHIAKLSLTTKLGVQNDCACWL